MKEQEEDDTNYQNKDAQEDAAGGGSAGHPKPLLDAPRSTGKTVIKGKPNSVPNGSYLLQFFSNPKGTEGKTLRGSKSITTDASGNASFSFSTKKVVKVGQKVTATVMRAQTRDTSEFSSPQKVVAS